MKTVQYFIYISVFYLLLAEANATLTFSSYINRLKSYFTKPTYAHANSNTTVSITVVKKRDIKETIRRSAGHSTTNSVTAGSSTSKTVKHLDLVTTSTKKSTIPFGDLPVCDEDHLMVYLAELQAINPESIINLSTVDELYLICRQVSDSLDKMDTFLLTCRIPDEKDLYVQLIKGVDKLFDVLCEDTSKIKQKFEDHFQCLKDLHDDFESCYGPPDWTEDSSRKEICRAYKDIADCYYIKAAKVCGPQAAQAMKQVIRAVVETILTCKCKNVVINPKVDDVAPNGNINNLLYTNFIYLLLISIIKTLYIM